MGEEITTFKERAYAPSIDEIEFRFRLPAVPVEPNEVVGLHVSRTPEGYADKCYQSDGKVWEFPRDLEAFLTTPDDRLLFIDGVDRELEPILKYLGEATCEKLLSGGRVPVGGARLSYHGSLTVQVGKVWKRIWALKPFYPAYMVPYDDDCYGVQARGVRLVKCLVSLGLPLALNSCGAVLSAAYNLPYMDYPREVAAMAYNSYHGGWIESFKLGAFDEAYDYDLASAYPSEASRLVSASSRYGSWFRSNKFVQEAVYGFALCRVRLDTSLPFSPLMLRIRSFMHMGTAIRSVRNPVGSWEGWLTKEEIEFVARNWLGTIEIQDGWWFVPREYRQPFLGLIKSMNALRQQAKASGDALAAYITKIVPAALQGKFIQTSLVDGVRVTGPSFNPVYAATITARVRLKVAALALEDYQHILATIVDGVLADKPLPVDRSWKLEYSGRAVIANHGDYEIAGRTTTSPLVKTLSDHYYSTAYPLRGPRYISLAEALAGKCFELAGRVRPVSYSKVSSVGKRLWRSLPKVCGDLLEKQFESYPMSAVDRAVLEGDPIRPEDFSLS
ncbi:MAG: hypothetical protein QW212_00640 [Nitrososphaerales archaeon]